MALLVFELRALSRFYIDECLSAALVAVAKERGLVADFGPHIGKAGWQDWNIARFAFENDYILVTNNRRDFLREYLKYEIHAGLVIMVPNVEREPQIKLFSRVLDHLAAMNDMPINKLIEIMEDGTIHIRDWSRDSHDVGHIRSPDWSTD